MFESLVFALAVSSASLSCNELGMLSADSDKLQKWEAWPEYSCQVLKQTFKDVHITAGEKFQTAVKKSRKVENGFSLSEVRAGRARLSWAGYENGQRISRSLWLTINALDEAWRVSRYLKKDQKIRRRDVEKVTLNVANYHGVKQLRTLSPVGLRVLSALPVGQVIDQTVLAGKPVLKKNQKVDVTITKGPVTIKSVGKVMANVYSESDDIYVKLNQSQKTMKGTLGDDEVVFVQL